MQIRWVVKQNLTCSGYIEDYLALDARDACSRSPIVETLSTWWFENDPIWRLHNLNSKMGAWMLQPPTNSSYIKSMKCIEMPRLLDMVCGTTCLLRWCPGRLATLRRAVGNVHSWPWKFAKSTRPETNGEEPSVGTGEFDSYAPNIQKKTR